MTEIPSKDPGADPGADPDADPAAEPRLDLLSDGTSPSVQPYTDPVEEKGARFAAEADQDDDGTHRSATGGEAAAEDLSPDFLAPTQPS